MKITLLVLLCSCLMKVISCNLYKFPHVSLNWLKRPLGKLGCSRNITLWKGNPFEDSTRRTRALTFPIPCPAKSIQRQTLTAFCQDLHWQRFLFVDRHATFPRFGTFDLAATFHLGTEQLRRHQVNWMAKWGCGHSGWGERRSVVHRTKERISVAGWQVWPRQRIRIPITI